MSAISSKKIFPQLPFTLLDAAVALLGFVLTALLTFGLYILRQISGIESVSELLGISTNTLSLIAEYIATGIILTIVYFLIIRRRHLDWRKFGFLPVKFWTTLGWVTLGFIVTFIIWMAVTPIFIFFLPQIDLTESQEIFQSGMSITAQVLMIVYAVIVGPFVEEVVFRGVVLTSTSNRFGLVMGVIISTGIWSILHFQANIIIFTMIFGVVLSYMYFRTQSLWTCYLTHVLKNLIAVIALYLIGF